MLSEEPPLGSTEKPDELYSIIEHFCQCRRRLELFGEDGNVRALDSSPRPLRACPLRACLPPRRVCLDPRERSETRRVPLQVRRGWLTLGKDLAGSNHDPVTWARYFEGTVPSSCFEDEPPTQLPNHLLGTTPQIEALRPKSPTQLREDAQRRAEKEARAREEKARAAAQEEAAAAAEMGFELEPVVAKPQAQMPVVPTHFVEQHPFNAGGR